MGAGAGHPGSSSGSTLTGTVKSYSAVKGFGFLLHPDIPQDIWFARESIFTDLRTSDLAGTAVIFELYRAPDGKPQARNLRPATATPLGPPLLHGCGGIGGCGLACAGKGLVPLTAVPGKGAFLAGKGFPLGAPMLGKGLAFVPGKGFVPAGLAGAPAAGGTLPGVLQTPGRRAWSPHAGSRAIRKCSKDAPSSPSSKHSSRSRSSGGKSSKSSRSSKASTKQKKSKKSGRHGSKSGSQSRHSSSSSSSSSRRSRSRGRRRHGSSGASASSLPKDGAPPQKESKEVEEAKMEALNKLTKLQAVEPRERRAKEWRSLLRAWHPDKNPEKPEVATAVFQFLQKGKQLLNLA